MTSNSHPFVLLHVDKHSTLESFPGLSSGAIGSATSYISMSYCNYHYAGRWAKYLRAWVLGALSAEPLEWTVIQRSKYFHCSICDK